MKLAPALALAPAPPWYPKFGPYIYIVILSIHHHFTVDCRLAPAPAPNWYPKFGPYIYIVIVSIHHK